MLQALNRVSGRSGWRRRAVLLTCGVAAALALPPTFVLPGFLIGLSLWGWMVAHAPSARTAFHDGWWFGFGHGILAYYWISHAFLVKPEVHGWMIPFAVGGLGAGLALFPAVAAWASHRISSHWQGRVLALIPAFSLVDWLRGHILTGFPWNLPATVWSFSDWTIQPAAIVGVYGVGLLTYLIALAPLWMLSQKGTLWRRAALASPLITMIILVGGGLRVELAPAVVTDPAEGAWRLRMVQPNLQQELKWEPSLRAAHFRDLLELSVSESVQRDQPVVIIWPETATPFFLSEDTMALKAAGRILRAGDLVITGAPSRTDPAERDWKLHNSVHVITAKGEIADTYHKAHLVPFGEYMPLKEWLPFGKLTAGNIDFSPGASPRHIQVENLPNFSPLVCYEVIFPGSVTATHEKRPKWLLNLTNDGWFGLSSGPYQHLAAARFRAVEEGLPLVRVANTGISAYFDGLGRKVAEIPLGMRGIVDSPLLDSDNYALVYVLVGDTLFFLGVFMLVGLVLVAELLHRRRYRPT